MKRNCKSFDDFKALNGLEFMIKAFDTLLTYHDHDTRELFREELLDAMKHNDPTGPMKLLNILKEIVAATGFPVPIEIKELYGKKSTSMAIAPIQNYLAQCVKSGTLELDDVQLLLEEHVDKDTAVSFANKLKYEFTIR